MTTMCNTSQVEEAIEQVEYELNHLGFTEVERLTYEMESSIAATIANQDTLKALQIEHCYQQRFDSNWTDCTKGKMSSVKTDRHIVRLVVRKLWFMTRACARFGSTFLINAFRAAQGRPIQLRLFR